MEGEVGENDRLWGFIRCAVTVATAPLDPTGAVLITAACAPLFKESV